MVQSNLAGTSKIQILESPRLAPGTCVVCGASRTDDRQYIDLGIYVEFVGQIYFCTFCMTELANQLGCLTPEQTIKLETELEAAHKTILEFQKEKSALNDSIAILRNTGLFSAGPDPRGNAFNNFEVNPDEYPDKQDIVGPDRETEQSVIEQGSDDLPTTSNDKFSEFGI